MEGEVTISKEELGEGKKRERRDGEGQDRLPYLVFHVVPVGTAIDPSLIQAVSEGQFLVFLLETVGG